MHPVSSDLESESLFCVMQALLLFHLHEISFLCLYFHSDTAFHLRRGSRGQHMSESCFLTHSAALCLLIGAFNPFTVKVIINRYVVIAIIHLSVHIYGCFFFSS